MYCASSYVMDIDDAPSDDAPGAAVVRDVEPPFCDSTSGRCANSGAAITRPATSGSWFASRRRLSISAASSVAIPPRGAQPLALRDAEVASMIWRIRGAVHGVKTSLTPLSILRTQKEARTHGHRLKGGVPLTCPPLPSNRGRSSGNFEGKTPKRIEAVCDNNQAR